MLNPRAPHDPDPAAPRLPHADEHPTLQGIEDRLDCQLDDTGRNWLREALADAARAPGEAAWELHFASAGRHCGRRAAGDARVLLLHAAAAGTDTLTRLYRQGTAAERAAVLHALPLLPAGAAPEALPLVEDALRANDTTLVAAAVGPYAAAHLDPHGWRHAVLKCLFTSVPLGAVAGLARRAGGDAELARMLTDFAHECTAAGRPVPADLHRALDLTGSASPPAGTGAPEEPAPAHPPEES
ncbi:sugar phosphate isomerase [Streptomyces bathyalis]|uniref:Sugar phosphate isomerase n=1 Tax=Streptomyces bathyalis TaxID=2710756 RepID=A0A7T1WSG7_9ACTN|nr:EboA domain-containing protein [Streptomyces bathyalis]QPP05725.1 sugar phosphate isomerase [Streptomyces bathyalis]